MHCASADALCMLPTLVSMLMLDPGPAHRYGITPLPLQPGSTTEFQVRAAGSVWGMKNRPAWPTAHGPAFSSYTQPVCSPLWLLPIRDDGALILGSRQAEPSTLNPPCHGAALTCVPDLPSPASALPLSLPYSLASTRGRSGGWAGGGRAGGRVDVCTTLGLLVATYAHTHQHARMCTHTIACGATSPSPVPWIRPSHPLVVERCGGLPLPCNMGRIHRRILVAGPGSHNPRAPAGATVVLPRATSQSLRTSWAPRSRPWATSGSPCT